MKNTIEIKLVYHDNPRKHSFKPETEEGEGDRDYGNDGKSNDEADDTDDKVLFDELFGTMPGYEELFEEVFGTRDGIDSHVHFNVSYKDLNDFNRLFVRWRYTAALGPTEVSNILAKVRNNSTEFYSLLKRLRRASELNWI